MVERKQLLDSLVRSVICAESGHLLFAIDYAAIEARGVCWLAGQWDAVERFREYDRREEQGLERHDVDNYIVTASKIYGIPTVMIDGDERKLGKIAVLGCGYGMGHVRFSEQCDDWGVEISDKLANTAVQAYRTTHPRVRELWYAMDAAAKKCVQTKVPQTVGRNMYFRMQRIGNIDALVMVLPSGRALYYPQATVSKNRLQYWGRRISGGLGMVDIWGGGLVENAVQALCRDLLMGAMLRARKHVDIIMHVHDEIVAQVRKELAEEMYNLVCELMKQTPVWATGFPIGVDGWIGERYRK